MFLSKRSNGIYYLWLIDKCGKKQKVSTGSKLKSDALQFMHDYKENEKQGIIRVIKKTLAQFFDDYSIYSKSVHTLKTQRSIKIAFREFIRVVGNIQLSKVQVREIEGFLATKKVEASEWTARSYYIHLASAFETAKRWHYVHSNPFREVQKPKTREMEPVFFSKTNIQLLLSIVQDEKIKELILVALFTGLRLSELINLQWSDVDFLSRVIHVRNTKDFTTKSRKNRSIPINEQLYQLLARMKEYAGSELVFHAHGKMILEGWISKKFKKAVRKAGLNDKLHFHSLRHTFATWLVQDGVNIYEVQKLLGHSSVSVTEVYAHLAASELHSAVNRITLN